MTTAARYRRLSLVVGSPGSGPGGIQERFVEEIGRLKQRDPLRPLVVLVGSNYQRLHLQRLLAVRLGGHANISFLLLKDLARRLGTDPLVLKGRRRLPRYGRDLLLAEVVKVRSHGTYFENIARREGFLEVLATTLRDLKEAGVEPATLRASAQAMKEGRSGAQWRRISAGKLEDLSDLLETYDDLVRDRMFYDEQDLMRAAAAVAAAAEGPPVVVYGFYDATWLQRSLLKQYLSFRQGAVLFPSVADDPDNAYGYAQPMLDWLGTWIPERVDLPPADEGREEPQAEIVSAPGEPREAVEAVRWLVMRARDRSIPFGEMALLYRSPEGYAGVIQETMQAAGGVPWFAADGQPLMSTLPARALLMLMDLRRRGFSRRAVIDLLSLTQADHQAALWDRFSREAGVVKGIEDWRGRLEKLSAARRRDSGEALRPGDHLKAIDSLRWRVEQLHEALEEIPLVDSWAKMAAAAAGAMLKLAGSDPSAGAVEARILELGGLDDVSTPVGQAQFSEILRRSLEEGILRGEGHSTFQGSGVFVGNVMDARLLSFAAVAIVGLVERRFPVGPQQDPILLDEERREINSSLAESRLPLKARRLDEERLLYALATSSAADGLLLSYPRLDPATARPRNPSPFLLRTARRLEGRDLAFGDLDRIERTRRVSLSALAPGDSRAAIFSREFDLGVLHRAAAESVSRGQAASFLHGNLVLHRALLAEEARWTESRFTAHDGVLLRPNVIEFLRAAHPIAAGPVSAHRIQSYASCPLAYFMSEVLDLQPLDEPEDAEGIDPLRRGSLVHRILFDLYTNLRQRGALPITPANLAGALEALVESCRRCYEREEEAGVPGHALMWEIDKERIHEDLAQLLAQEAGEETPLRPAYFEVRYGMPPREDDAEDPLSTSAPVEMEIAPGRKVSLKGKIDRIDVSPDGSEAVVTDYKSGAMSRLRADSLQGGTSVQLPLYMIAAEKLLAGSHPGIKATSARYLSADRRGKFRSIAFTEEALRQRGADLGRVVSTALNGIARGVFFAYPVPEVCQYCDYQLACGEGRRARFDRKRSDATAADYLRMREEIA